MNPVGLPMRALGGAAQRLSAAAQSRFMTSTRSLLTIRALILGMAMALLRVSSAQSVSHLYGGVGACAECHQSTINLWNTTAHAHAYQTLLTAPTTTSGSLASHTVGYGFPTGFRSAATTPRLEGVQCENCHGGSANHAANFIDLSALPSLDLSAAVCGGCHSGLQHPFYAQWITSDHSHVPGLSEIPDMNPASRINACGRCHSASVRLSLLKAEPLPTGGANMPVTCVVCHDPHDVHSFANVLNGVYKFTNKLTGETTVINNRQLGAVYTQQLLNPLASTVNYSISTNGTLPSQYKANINLCAQCHNDRGASWSNSSEPPHHSLQYNMLLGTVGVLTNSTAPNLPGTHSQLEKQCVSCHMQTQVQPAITGHSFKVELFNVCTPCHDDQGQGLVEFLSFVVTNRVSELKGSLDSWATNKAPSALKSYGTRAWEYVTPGDLSPGGPGPTAKLQALIPVNIQKARFDLYSVHNDGSGGVHNPAYVLTLLDTADAWVQGELNKP